MADTKIKLRFPESLNPSSVEMEPETAGQVEGDASGYTLANGAKAWSYEFTVPQACVGFYHVYILDADGNVLDVGAVEIPADVAGPFEVTGDLTAAKTASDARRARQMATNKQVWAEQPDGTFDITVRDDADTYDELTVNGFNRRTGSRDQASL